MIISPFSMLREFSGNFMFLLFGMLLFVFSILLPPQLILSPDIVLLSFGASAVVYLLLNHDRNRNNDSDLLECIAYEENYSPARNNKSRLLKYQLEHVYLRKLPGVFDFLKSSLCLKSFDYRKSVVICSSDYYNTDILPENFAEFYFNIHEINDIGNLNEYFGKINSRLIDGGYYAGRVEPTHLRYERFLNTYPFGLAQIIYFFDFIWMRIMPNLPFLRKIYFALSNGKKKALSFAETLGRLYYCGFEICTYKTFDNFIYFICRKVRNFSGEGDPVYGPFIKLERVGLWGVPVNIYKFRTMHPYSEYVQKFIYEINHLDAGGKIKNDFRVTSWGHIMRKLWIDELPMLINLFKGELKIVGVRPLSAHYFSLYDSGLQEERIKYKPGLLPPFYYDLPKTLPEIMDSERKYLSRYRKHPFITDLRYFFAIFYNIVFKRARSK